MRRHINIMFGQGLVIALLVGLLIGLSPVVFTAHFAFADGGDSFNDNSKDLTKWGTEIVSGRCVLEEINSRLEYTCEKASPNFDQVILPWVLTELPYNTDWEMQIDTTNNTVLTENYQWTGFGLGIMSQYSDRDAIYADLYASTYGGLPPIKGFWAELDAGANTVGSADTGGLGVTNGAGAIRLRFNSTTKVIRVDYDIDPSNGYQWVEYGSFGVGGSGGNNGNADWGLTGTDKFRAFVYGYSESITITSGQLYGDNFLETGGVAPLPAVLSVSEGTLGTRLTFTGTGFGTKKGKVLIENTATKITNWTDTSITCNVSKVPLPTGSYPAIFDVTIRRQPYKTTSPFSLTDAFTVRNPWISSHSPASGTPGTEVKVNGTFFGAKKGKVYLEGQSNGQKKSCKVTSWTMNLTDGTSEMTFIVPKVDAGNYWLYVTNKVGTNPPGVPYQVN
jgi:hypothetical protein